MSRDDVYEVAAEAVMGLSRAQSDPQEFEEIFTGRRLRLAADAAYAHGERAATTRIAAALRDEGIKNLGYPADAGELLRQAADLIERGEFDDVAASND
jgi:hypothetical protein